MHELQGWITNLCAAWNGSLSFFTGTAEVYGGRTPVRSRGLLGARERPPKVQEGRWEFALALGVVEFSLSFVWCMVQRLKGGYFVGLLHGFLHQMAEVAGRIVGLAGDGRGS